MSFVEYVLNAKEPLAAPLAGFPGVELTNTTIAQNLHDSAVQAKTLIAMNQEVDLDIIFPMMDLTVEAESLGGHIDWDTDEMPTIRDASIETLEDAQSIVIPELGVGNRLNVYVETCDALRKAFPDKLVWAYVLGPFSIAGRLMGMTEISIAVKLEPEVVHATLEKCQTLLVKYINALLDTGVDGLMILEPASSLLREDDATEFSNNYMIDLVEIIKSRGKTPALHNCGNIGHLVESLCKTGIEVLHVGSAVDPYEIYPRIPENVVLMGNLNPNEVFKIGTPESVKDATVKLSDKMADFERYVISSGCDIPPGSSMENLKAFRCAVRPCDPVNI